MTAAAASTAMASHGAGAPPTSLPSARPEQLGIDPRGIMAFLEQVERTVGGLHGMMLLRHGKVAARAWWRPYTARAPHMLFSLTKSFTSTAAGFAVHDGKLALDAPVLSFFPDRAPAQPDANMRAMQVRHLLTMTTGHDQDATGPMTRAEDGDWVRAFLHLPVEHPPGTKFVYNSAASHMVSAIVQQVMGQPIHLLLRERLFQPLGISGEQWQKDPKGIALGGWGLSLTTEGVARFGQMLLQGGVWAGRQLVPADWVAQATSRQVSNGTDPNSDWAQGYGYQFWRCRHGAYRGDGAFGQFCVVMPEQDAVLAITSGVPDMGAVLQAAWDRLLPAMRPSSLRPGRGESEALQAMLRGRALAVPEGDSEPAAPDRISGRSYLCAENPDGWKSLRVTLAEDHVRIETVTAGATSRYRCGYRDWISGTMRYREGPAKVAARAAWQRPDTLVITLCYTETPFVETHTLRFEDDRLTINRRVNVSFGPTTLPEIRARRA